MPDMNMQIYQKYIDGEPIWKLSTRYGKTLTEVTTIITASREQMPTVSAKDLSRDIEIQLLEEIGRLNEMRKVAAEGYETTEMQTKTSGEYKQTTEIIKEQRHLSAAASFSREIRETIKLLALIRGITGDSDKDKNITVLLAALKEAPAPDEYARLQSRGLRKN